MEGIGVAMKAVVCERYGSPSVLQLKEVDKPVHGDSEILIRVHASTVNRTDTATMRAQPFFARMMTGMFKPKRQITGTEFAGEIVAVGSEVKAFRVGERVYGFNDSGSGSHAEYMKTSEDSAVTSIPEVFTFKQAAASSEGTYYAYNFLNKVNLEKGQKVLVNGATGAIGSAAVQLLKNIDIHVTAVCRGEHFDLVRSLGADELIDYTRCDFTETDHTYRCIFDTVGKSSFGKCRSLLEPGGAYISSELGSGGQNLLLALTTKFSRRKVIFPLPVDPRGCMLFVRELIKDGRYRPVIDREYPIERIAEAYTYVETGQKVGNVVITLK